MVRLVLLLLLVVLVLVVELVLVLVVELVGVVVVELVGVVVMSVVISAAMSLVMLVLLLMRQQPWQEDHFTQVILHYRDGLTNTSLGCHLHGHFLA